MKATLTALTVAATMFASSASAFDPDDLQTLKDTNRCARCDLRKANLTGAKLMDAKLSNAFLMDANLMDANLMGADLTRANLTEANLMDVDLRGADLRGANLRGAKLSYTIMKGAILCNTTMPDGSVIYSGC